MEKLLAVLLIIIGSVLLFGALGGAAAGLPKALHSSEPGSFIGWCIASGLFTAIGALLLIWGIKGVNKRRSGNP